jgi:PBP1b-binding outer membrane lipoprotein LpoB
LPVFIGVFKMKKLITALFLLSLLAACADGQDADPVVSATPEQEVCKDSTKQWTWAWQKWCTESAAQVK